MQPPIPAARRHRGFTLIELLTVIAIIGILAAIIIPTVSKVRSHARNTQCVAQLREWGRIINMYALENKGNYYSKSWASDDSSEAPGGISYKSYFTKSRYDLFAMRYCPSDPETDQILASSDPRSDPRYAMVRGSINNNPATLADERRIPLTKARAPSQYMLMVDAVKNSGAVVTMTTIGDMISPAAAAGLVLPADPRRHGGKFNAVFGDGSMKRVGYSTSPADTTSVYSRRLIWFQLY